MKMNWKKVLSLVLVLCMVWSCFGVGTSVQADDEWPWDEEQTTVIEDGEEYEFYMVNGSINGSRLFRCYKSDGNVVVPNGVEYIDQIAFSELSNIKTITLPASVKDIGMSAFAGCTGLEEIKLPEGLVSIGGWAFSGCTSLKNIVIPDSVNTIVTQNFGTDMNPFYGCDALNEIKFDGKTFADSASFLEYFSNRTTSGTDTQEPTEPEVTEPEVTEPEEEKEEVEPKGYLVLIQDKNGNWMGYRDFAYKSTSGGIMVPAKAISKKLGLAYKSTGKGKFTIAKGSTKECAYTVKQKEYKYTKSGEKTSRTVKYAPENKNDRNNVYSLGMTSLVYSKYYKAASAPDYVACGYKGIVCYSRKGKITELPKTTEITNAEELGLK